MMESMTESRKVASEIRGRKTLPGRLLVSNQAVRQALQELRRVCAVSVETCGLQLTFTAADVYALARTMQMRIEAENDPMPGDAVPGTPMLGGVPLRPWSATPAADSCAVPRQGSPYDVPISLDQPVAGSVGCGRRPDEITLSTAEAEAVCQSLDLLIRKGSADLVEAVIDRLSRLAEARKAG